MSKPKFWMVVGLGTPTVRHTSWESAKQEAERLARMNPGQSFTVMSSIATVTKSDVRWAMNGDDEDDEQVIPF